MTEATLPVEERGTQKRYREVGRFNHFLPPVGKFRLKLELKDRVPTLAEGGYQLLLRIEASDDKESDSNLQVLGVGTGTVHSGAVASFPMPSLKFFVTGEENNNWPETALLIPAKDAVLSAPQTLVFNWRELSGAALYRLKVFEKPEEPLFSALLPGEVTSYRSPSIILEKFKTGRLGWQIEAIDRKGNVFNKTEIRTFSIR
ncbi:MAG: hypothetical protein R2747_13780 [Pyrinomonadaceae bacterium]